MPDATWTTYRLQEKIFSIGEDFWIENDKGEEVFRVDGKAFSLRNQFVLQDSKGSGLLTVETKLLSFQPMMTIQRQDQLYATVTKQLFTLFHDHYTIQVEGGPAYEAEGDFTSHEYEVRSNDDLVTQISRAWFSLRDSYGVAVAPGHDQALMLVAAVCIDEITEQAARRRHNLP
jgi:uncharacterized protein YxjI